MVLIFDFQKKVVMGNATAKDIRQLGLIRASRANHSNPFDNPEDVTKWSQLFTDTDEEDNWKPDPNAEEDEEW